MTQLNDSGFAKFVPGFDFLQSLAKGAASGLPQMPNLTNWVSPSLNLEELEKRISELKAVHFWLDQNGKALNATIQALEVQRMTLATLKGMNFDMSDVANALKMKAADSVVSGMQKGFDRAASAAKAVTGVGAPVTGKNRATPRAQTKRNSSPPPKVAAPGLVDPVQLWGSLTQQFQQIATAAMKDATKQASLDATKSLATGLAKQAVQATGAAVRKVAKKASGQ